jgi:flagellin
MISINTNTSSTLASFNLQKSSDLLQKSLARLSSGSRIATAADDAGGLAVSMKLSSAIKRTANASSNVSNALSFLQVQAGTLKTAATVLDRMAELVTLNLDVTKSDADKAAYSTEFKNLYSELGVMAADKFNGVPLFSAIASNTTGRAGDLTLYISQDGSQTMQLKQVDLSSAMNGLSSWNSLTGAAGASKVTTAVQSLATLMATNGALSSRVQFAIDALNTNQVSLEASLSRIYDVDVAAETAKLARANILVQSGAAMLTQANASQSIALKLLQ